MITSIARLLGLKSDVLSRLSGNVLVYVLSNGLQRGMTVLVTPLLLRRLTITEYGQYGLLLSLFVLASSVFSIGLNSAIGRFYFDDTDPTRRLRIVGVLLSAHAASVLLLALTMDLSLGWMLNAIGDVPYHPYVRWTLWASASAAIFDGVVAFWRSAERPTAVAAANLASFGVTTAAIAFFLLSRNLGLSGVLLGMMLGQAVVAIAAWLIATAETGIAWDGTVFYHALRFGVPLLPHMTAAWLLRLSDRWMLDHYVGSGRLGGYVFSYQIASVLSLTLFSANEAITPRFLASFRDGGAIGAQHFHRRFYPVYCWIAVILASGLLLLAPLLGRLLSSGKVHQDSALTSLLVAAMLTSALYGPFANALFAVKATARLAMISLSCGVLNVILNLVFIPWLGPLGSAVAMLVSYLALLVSMIVLARHQLGLKSQGLHLGAAAIVFGFLAWFHAR